MVCMLEWSCLKAVGGVDEVWDVDLTLQHPQEVFKAALIPWVDQGKDGHLILAVWQLFGPIFCVTLMIKLFVKTHVISFGYRANNLSNDFLLQLHSDVNHLDPLIELSHKRNGLNLFYKKKIVKWDTSLKILI